MFASLLKLVLLSFYRLSNFEFLSLIRLRDWFNCLCIFVRKVKAKLRKAKGIWNNTLHSLKGILNELPAEDASFGLICSSSCARYP